MAETLKTFASLLRSLVTLVLLVFLSVAGWIAYQTVTSHSRLETELKERTAEIEKLNSQVATQAKQIEELDLTLRLLKRNHRLAEIRVVDQWISTDEKKVLMTKLEFVEVDDQEQPIDKPRVFTIEGDIVYIEAWIVKYLDQFVEKGDLVRGTSICLFKRLYGEYQEPSEGFVLDTVGSRPAAYSREGSIPEFERDIWKQFWDFANDPDKAQQAGIRAAHGDAPFVKLRPGKIYLIDLRASDGLTIRAKDSPPATDKEL
jgi:cell division protein FtsL